MTEKEIMYNICVLPGDGIGKEVTREAIKVIQRVAELNHLVFKVQEGIVGGASIDQNGIPITDEVLNITKHSDAVLLGAVGGPKWEHLDYKVRPERALLKLRSELKLFANLRPVKMFQSLIHASTLKPEVVGGIDMLVMRELTGGIYFGQPKGVEKLPDGQERGFNTEVYTTHEIERIAEKAFQFARKRRKKVTSVDKANVLESSELWRKTVTRIAKKFPDVALDHMYVDNAAMQLVRNPKSFDVMLTSNLFGDILSDEAAMLTGSIGMLPSASLGEHTSLYEPVHGSAPDIEGKNMANPIAAILSVAMMLRYTFNLIELAQSVEKAVQKVLDGGFRTADIKSEGTKEITCSEMGDKIVGEIK